MSGILMMIIAIVVLGGAYLLYGRYLQNKWGIDPNAKTPAYEMEDGVDYVPALSLIHIQMCIRDRSKGEFNSVCQAVGGYEKLIDQECKDKDLLALITYLAEEDKAEKILENQKVIKTPIVRNGKQATVGYQPDIWKNWK